MSNKEEIEKFYKDILPNDVLGEIASDYNKVAEKQEKEVKNNKEMVRANLMVFDFDLSF